VIAVIFIPLFVRQIGLLIPISLHLSMYYMMYILSPFRLFARYLQTSLHATGDAVLAVFPDTTSFYHGRISKPVKQRGSGGEISVQFDEDEDESGCV